MRKIDAKFIIFIIISLLIFALIYFIYSNRNNDPKEEDKENNNVNNLKEEDKIISTEVDQEVLNKVDDLIGTMYFWLPVDKIDDMATYTGDMFKTHLAYRYYFNSLEEQNEPETIDIVVFDSIIKQLLGVNAKIDYQSGNGGSLCPDNVCFFPYEYNDEKKQFDSFIAGALGVVNVHAKTIKFEETSSKYTIYFKSFISTDELEDWYIYKDNKLDTKWETINYKKYQELQQGNIDETYFVNANTYKLVFTKIPNGDIYWKSYELIKQ